MTRIFFAGGIVLDITYDLPSWPQPAGAVHTQAVTLSPGGKAVNMAVAARRMGADAALVGCVGDDFVGTAILEALAAGGVDIELIRRHPDAGTGVITMLVHDTVPSFIGAPRASRLLAVEDVERAQQHFTSDSIVVVDYEVSQEVVRAALEQAKAAGAVTILNPAPLFGVLPAADYWPLVDYLIPNEAEAQHILDTGEAASPNLARRLLALGVGGVCITLGERGSLFVDRDGNVISTPAIPIQVVDSTGASDVFCGVFAVGLAENRAMADILKWASAASALACTLRGTMPAIPARDAVEALLRDREHFLE